MTRTEIINGLIKKYGFKTYLEIGVQNKANNFDKIEAEIKVCVDPDPKAEADCAKTSDEYFMQRAFNENAFGPFPTIDLVFIDGLHEADQVERDIENSLNCLSRNGYIVVHDCLPTSEEMQKVPRETKQWTGDCWKAIVRFRNKKNIGIVTVDTDWGCALICHGGTQLPLERPEELTYENFVKNRDHWMSVISAETFKRFYL